MSVGDGLIGVTGTEARGQVTEVPRAHKSMLTYAYKGVLGCNLDAGQGL